MGGRFIQRGAAKHECALPGSAAYHAETNDWTVPVVGDAWQCDCGRRWHYIRHQGFFRAGEGWICARDGKVLVR